MPFLSEFLEVGSKSDVLWDGVPGIGCPPSGAGVGQLNSGTVGCYSFVLVDGDLKSEVVWYG